MKKWSNSIKHFFEFLLLELLTISVLISLFSLNQQVIKNGQSDPADTTSQKGQSIQSTGIYNSYPPPIVTLTPSSKNSDFQKCNFKDNSKFQNETSTATFKFDPPIVVLQSKSNIDLVNWISENKSVLLLRDLPESGQQEIGVFDVDLKVFRSFAERKSLSSKPVWVPSLKSVLFTTNLAGETQHKIDGELWISRGDPRNIQKISQNLSNLELGLENKNNQIAFWSVDNLNLVNQLLEVSKVGQITATQLTSQKQASFPIIPSKMAFRPTTTQLALYNNYNILIIDPLQTDVCKIDLGANLKTPIWSPFIYWSSDGRYLAIIKAEGNTPFLYSDLAIYDTANDELKIIKIGAEIQGKHYVTDVAWGPDNRHLLAISEIIDINGKRISGVNLVDAQEKKSQPILSGYELGGGDWDTNMAWSTDGRNLMVACPTETEEKLCLVNVQT
jgi:hypothetical protein